MTKKSELALLALASELERLERANTELREEVRRDHLTGAYNLRALLEHVDASRYEGWYVFADGDGLGRLNKTVGHDTVNRYIVEFGDWLRQQTRYVRDGFDGVERRRNPATADAIATRFGGDEFVIWCSNKRGALRIRNAIRTWRSRDHLVSFSAGMGRDRAIADSNCTHFKERRRAA